tara:strand:+ start:62 stop:958 length:897 start_codon:yes stop_codon:yes gene_type:complete
MENSKEEKISYIPNVTAEIKKDLAAGRPVVGTMFIEPGGVAKLKNPFISARELGYRFVIMDHEHKAYNEETLARYTEMAHRAGISIWIRPGQLNEAPVSRYADMGFNGFLVANIIDVFRLKHIINQAYYDPIADKKAHIRRGYSMGSLLLDGQKFPTFAEEMDYINENTIVVLQIEHQEAITNLDKLLSLEGVQGAVIGMNDLSVNLSRLPGNSDLLKILKDKMYSSEPLKKSFREIAEASEKLSKPAGVHIVRVSQLELVKLLIDEMGYRLMVLGTEANFSDPKILKAKEYIESKNA